jgi:riboflavin kinase / FMN adenylyltransferase
VNEAAGRSEAGGTVVTVGTFDGVHRGHWRVLQELSRAAHTRGALSLLVTFDPHPLRIVRPEHAPPLLSTPAEKIEILAQSDIDRVAFLRFTPELAAFSPRTFVERILIGRFAMRHLVIGYDHGFGRGRSGDVDTLRAIGAELGFGVDVVPPVQDDGDAVSSSRIRRVLQEGDVAAAARALGRPYSVTGTVVRGEGKGRRLGFPTANLDVGSTDKLIPHEGIYAVRAALGDRIANGVLHLGPRPTFAGLPPSVELHVFDFDGDLYGRRIRVDFIERIRDIAAFATVDALVRAMEADCAEARRRLALVR